MLLPPMQGKGSENLTVEFHSGHTSLRMVYPCRQNERYSEMSVVDVKSHANFFPIIGGGSLSLPSS